MSSRLRSILRRGQLNGMQAPETRTEKQADAMEKIDQEFAE